MPNTDSWYIIKKQWKIISKYVKVWPLIKIHIYIVSSFWDRTNLFPRQVLRQNSWYRPCSHTTVSESGVTESKERFWKPDSQVSGSYEAANIMYNLHQISDAQGPVWYRRRLFGVNTEALIIITNDNDATFFSWRKESQVFNYDFFKASDGILRI